MRKVSFSAAALCLLVSAPAHADHVMGTRFDLREKSHEISVRVDRGSATLVVRRTVQNLGPKSDQALFSLEIPEAAAATRLRTEGTAHNWFEGELMDAEVAAKKYEELTGIGGYYPKDPALLSWRHRGELKLQVFPVPAKSEKTVEYTLEMPMRYEDGTYRLELPVLGTDTLPASVRVAAGTPGDALRVNGVRVSGSQLVETKVRAQGEPLRSIDIELEPQVPGPLAMRLADVRIAQGRRLLHASFDAAPKLGTVPKNAAIAIVLDTSKSMEGDVPASLAAIRAYLSNFTTGQVSVITFDRTVHTPFGSAAPLADTMAALHGWNPTLGNGSALDAAILAADKMLAASGNAARRMMVLTDLRMRDTLTASKLAALDLKSGAIMHIAHVEDGGAETLRDDDDEWSKLPRKTGGLLWSGRASAQDPIARTVFEEWARPVRLDHLRVLGLADYATDESMLQEGQAIEHLVLATTDSSRVRVEGELWSKPFRSGVSSDPSEERRWSALVFGTDLGDELTEPEQLTLAMKGKAVSPMTSYLAIEPGVRPSTEGLEKFELSGVGEGGGGIGQGIGLGRMGAVGHGASFDFKGFLQTQLTADWKRCGGTGHATVQLQSTLVEVVDVTRVQVGKADMTRQTCLHEAAWALDLPDDFNDTSNSWTLEIDS